MEFLSLEPGNPAKRRMQLELVEGTNVGHAIVVPACHDNTDALIVTLEKEGTRKRRLALQIQLPAVTRLLQDGGGGLAVHHQSHRPRFRTAEGNGIAGTALASSRTEAITTGAGWPNTYGVTPPTAPLRKK